MNLACLLEFTTRKAGGMFESVRRLAQSFPQTHGITSVFSTEDEHTAEDTPQWQPLRVRTFAPKYLPAWGYAPGLSEALQEANIDVLLVHGLWKYCSVVSLAWHRRTGRPYIIHPHGMLDPWAVANSKWKKRVAALLYENAHLRDAACLRALCESEAQSIRAFGLRNPICVIPNGMDLPELAEDSSMRVGGSVLAQMADGRKVLLYLGRLHPKKNLGPLIEAWAAMQRNSKSAGEWLLAIAGWDQGGYEAELRRLASDCSQLNSVLFLGPLFGDAKAAAYQSADAFVLPSLSEGLPMVVLEAWAYAKPVLMTSECNLPEGFQANAALRIGRDANSITLGLRELVNMSAADRAAMGGRGRILVSERFLWSKIGAEMGRVCEWVTGGGAPPASVRLN